IPDTDRALQRRCRQVAIVLAEDAVHLLVPLVGSYINQFEPGGLAAEHVKQSSRLPVPEPCAAIERYRRNSAAVVAEHNASQLGVALVTRQGSNLGFFRYVPKARRIADRKRPPRAYQHPASVRAEFDVICI